MLRVPVHFLRWWKAIVRRTRPDDETEAEARLTLVNK